MWSSIPQSQTFPGCPLAALKEKLGGGSYPTISRYLKQWRHNLGLEQDKPAPVQSGDKPHVQHDTPQAQVEKSKPQASSGSLNLLQLQPKARQNLL